MIERLAWRTGGFVGTTAEQTLRRAVRLIPVGKAPPRRSRLLRALPAVVGTAVGLAAGAVTASGRGGGPSSRSRPSGSAPTKSRSRATRNQGRAGAGARTASRTPSKVTGLAEKSRHELYEMAREAGIEGRSAMSKKELTRALAARPS
jgi:hypothetical protein